MVKRKIIKIDEKKCNGCGLCIPNCHEGALQIIDGKARLISDLFCDGLGACIGHCPQGAIKLEEREAEKYDERKVMQNIVKQGKNTIKAHLEHLQDHGETEFLNEALAFLKERKIKNPLEEDGKIEKMKKGNQENHGFSGCPGTAVREMKNLKSSKTKSSGASVEQESELRQWPVQLTLLPPHASFFDNSHLLVAADCVPFAYPNFHSKLLNGKSLVIGCPKLDDLDSYIDRLTEICKNNKIKSITVAIMEVPCCGGMQMAVEEAVKNSGKKIPIIQEVMGINGDLQ